jgi:hypothetical protein
MSLVRLPHACHLAEAKPDPAHSATAAQVESWPLWLTSGLFGGLFTFGLFLTFGVVQHLAWMHQSMQQLRLSTSAGLLLPIQAFILR